MIDEDRTLSLFGYTSAELKPHSREPIACMCEECGNIRVIQKRRYRDVCHSCAARTTHLGRKRSDETREKMRKPKTIEHAQNISKGLTGLHPSEESRRKMSAAHLGLNAGKNHYNWKGGITKWRNYIWRTPAYKAWRKAVFERDDYTCQMCNERGCYLEAHHIRPVKDHKNDLLIFDVDNGITLCKDCHNETKGVEDGFIKTFEVILS